jgi:hypothetical protein
MKFSPVVDLHHSTDRSNQNSTDYRQQAIDDLALRYDGKQDSQNYKNKARTHKDPINQR